MNKVYMATAYSHPDPQIMVWRFGQANRAAGALMQLGHIVFSPISHSHPISLHLNNSLSHGVWLAQDKAFLDWADKMVAVRFGGDPDPCAVYDSYGVNWEREYMHDQGKPVIDAYYEDGLWMP